MYLNFFDLKKEPFQITPDPSFLYMSAGHKEALASIIYGVEKKKGFVLIIGAVGVGKTTILRAYLEKVDKDQLRIIYLFNANISYLNLLKYIFRELGVVPESGEVSDMVTQLHQALIEEYKAGRNVLLLIDEAQNMPLDTLENVRMLSNLETASEKLIQIVFSGQPEFEKTLNLEELKQLKQRIAVKAVISPLTHKEGLTYISHRLRRASDREAVIFTKGALNEIVKQSGGIPRVINVLCDNSLITAFGYGKKKVGMAIVREITRDFGMRRGINLMWPVTIVVALLFGFGIFLSHDAPINLAKKVLHMELRPAAMPQSTPGPRVVTRKAGTEKVAEKRAVYPPDSPDHAPFLERKVVKGDTLARLIVEVYGHVDSRMIKLVKKANPHIDNENLIIEGGSIVFPVIKRR